MQAFMDCVRQAGSKAVWSRGVELARAEAVRGLSESRGEVTLQVTTRGGMVSYTATLYPGDEEWECTCRSGDDPCEHVAAACIALHRARKSGAGLPTPSESVGTIHYRLQRRKPGLAIEREIHHAGGVHLLESSLDAIARGRVTGPKFAASQADLAVERGLGTRRRGAVPPGLLPGLFAALEGCPDITLDGGPVEVSSEPLVPHCRLVNAPGGFRLILVRDPGVDELLGDGVALSAGSLRLRGETRLGGREIQQLMRGLFYSHGQVAELLTEVLPELRQRVQIDIDTDKLPQTSDSEVPRIAIAVERRGDALSVLPTLVYGDPAIARVDGQQLVHLRGKIPLRDKRAEALRVRHLRDSLGLSPGYRVDYRQNQAIAFAARLAGFAGAIDGDAHLSFFLGADLSADLEVGDDRIEVSFRSPAQGAAGAVGPAAERGADGDARPAAATADVLRAWQRGDSLVPLQSGGFAALPQGWLERYGDRVIDLLAAQPAEGPLPMSAMPDLVRLCEDLDHPPPASFERLRPLLEDFSGIAPASLPADFSGTLRGYQARGVDWLALLRKLGVGALLADDMGLGKTIQALCVLDGPSLIVCPTSVLFNWAEELQRFRPGVSFDLYHGSSRELAGDAQVMLTSYAILRLDIDALAARRWQTVILDEAQNIKNPDSQVARAAYRLDAEFRIALTGTPVENRLDELWSQLHFLNPGLLGGGRTSASATQSRSPMAIRTAPRCCANASVPLSCGARSGTLHRNCRR